MKNLFIDANIWLSLYDYTNDTLDKFESLNGFLSNGIKLFVSEQVYNEVLRNRDGRIKEAWNRFSQKSFHVNAPTFCQDYPEYKAFQKKNNELEKQYNTLKEKIENDIQTHSLKADKLLSDLFNGIERIKSSEDTIKKAEFRYKSGNPPGKDGSIGDAINWELLLQSVPDGEDLYLISGDQDYCSKFNEKKLNFFLEKEWKEKKKSNIFFYTTLQAFLQDHANSSVAQDEHRSETGGNEQDEQMRKALVELAKSIEDSSIEEKKNNAISLLQNSHSFANTHNAISLLSKYDSWTQEQIDAICDAAQMNDQIWLIINDEDVDDFYTSILKATKEETSSVIGLRKMLYGDYTEQLKDVIF